VQDVRYRSIDEVKEGVKCWSLSLLCESSKQSSISLISTMWYV
jgi:hypothetical protein